MPAPIYNRGLPNKGPSTPPEKTTAPEKVASQQGKYQAEPRPSGSAPGSRVQEAIRKLESQKRGTDAAQHQGVAQKKHIPSRVSHLTSTVPHLTSPPPHSRPPYEPPPDYDDDPKLVPPQHRQPSPLVHPKIPGKPVTPPKTNHQGSSRGVAQGTKAPSGNSRMVEPWETQEQLEAVFLKEKNAASRSLQAETYFRWLRKAAKNPEALKSHLDQLKAIYPRLSWTAQNHLSREFIRETKIVTDDGGITRIYQNHIKDFVLWDVARLSGSASLTDILMLSSSASVDGDIQYVKDDCFYRYTSGGAQWDREGVIIAKEIPGAVPYNVLYAKLSPQEKIAYAQAKERILESTSALYGGKKCSFSKLFVIPPFDLQKPNLLGGVVIAEVGAHAVLMLQGKVIATGRKGISDFEVGAGTCRMQQALWTWAMTDPARLTRALSWNNLRPEVQRVFLRRRGQDGRDDHGSFTINRYQKSLAKIVPTLQKALSSRADILAFDLTGKQSPHTRLTFDPLFALRENEKILTHKEFLDLDAMLLAIVNIRGFSPSGPHEDYYDVESVLEKFYAKPSKPSKPSTGSFHVKL